MAATAGINQNDLLLGLSAIGGGLGNRASTNTQSRTINDPTLMAMRNKLFQAYQPLLNPVNLKQDTASKISNVNRAARLETQNANEDLAMRGIQGPAASTAIRGIDSKRFGDIVDIQNNEPLLQRQLLEQALQNFGGYVNSAPIANTTGTEKESGNVAGGVTGNLASTLAFLIGQGNKGGAGGAANGLGGGLISKGISAIPGLIGHGASTATSIGGAGGIGGASGGTLTTSGSGLLGALGGAGTAIPLIGGGVVAALIAKHFIGEGRKQANKLTGEGGLQSNFNQGLADIVGAHQAGQISDDERNQLTQQLYAQLVNESQPFASGGKNQSKVVKQMLNSYFTNPVTSSSLASQRSQYAQYL